MKHVDLYNCIGNGTFTFVRAVKLLSDEYYETTTRVYTSDSFTLPIYVNLYYDTAPEKLTLVARLHKCNSVLICMTYKNPKNEQDLSKKYTTYGEFKIREYPMSLVEYVEHDNVPDINDYT